MPNAMERSSTFAATTVGKSFLPHPLVLSRRTNLDNAVNENFANEGVITAAVSRAIDRVIPTDKVLVIARWALLSDEALITDKRLFMINHTGECIHVSERRA